MTNETDLSIFEPRFSTINITLLWDSCPTSKCLSQILWMCKIGRQTPGGRTRDEITFLRPTEYRSMNVTSSLLFCIFRVAVLATILIISNLFMYFGALTCHHIASTSVDFNLSAVAYWSVTVDSGLTPSFPMVTSPRFLSDVGRFRMSMGAGGGQKSTQTGPSSIQLGSEVWYLSFAPRMFQGGHQTRLSHLAVMAKGGPW